MTSLAALWIGLAAVLLFMLAIEFGWRRGRMLAVTPGEALTGALGWFTVSVIGFAVMIYDAYQSRSLAITELIVDAKVGQNLNGAEALIQFLTAYVTELALSLDNLAMLAILFRYFNLTRQQIWRALFWYIASALVIRLALILIGSALAVSFSWMVYVFAGLLIIAMVRTLLMPDESTDFDNRTAVKFLRWLLPIGGDRTEISLTTRETKADGRSRRVVTNLGLVVMLAALADMTYATDSIPASLAITADAFLAFSAQALVILAMRSLYLAMTPLTGRMRYMKLTLVAIMAFIAGKTMFSQRGDIATEITLGVVTGILLLGVGASVFRGWQIKRAARLSASQPDMVGPLPNDRPDRPAPIEDVREAVLATRRNMRKIWILIAGTAVIVFGIAIAPLPGPGPTVLIPIGVAILATEFMWAQAVYARGKRLAENVTKRSDRVSKSLPRWVAFPVLLAFYGFWFWMYEIWEAPGWRTFVMASAFGGSFPILAWAYRLIRRSGSQRAGSLENAEESAESRADPQLRIKKSPDGESKQSEAGVLPP
jgi:tellurite resistance protein TerC